MSHHFSLRSVATSAGAIVLGISALASAPLIASAQEPHKMDGMSMPADGMDHSKMGGMKHMEGMSMTGNADYDFAVNMKMHHQMALEMAKAEIKDGKNPQMVKMAKSIVASQTKEIAAFDKWLAANKKPMSDGMTMPK